MEVSVAAHQHGSTDDMSYSSPAKGVKFACASHAFNVIMPHVDKKLRAATSKQRLQRRDFIHDLLWRPAPMSPPRLKRHRHPPEALSYIFETYSGR